jgi:hypothetical protein
MELERKLARDPSVEITLINGENFFLFTPMLHEVAASDLDLTTIVNPVREMLRRVNFWQGKRTRLILDKRGPLFPMASIIILTPSNLTFWFSDWGPSRTLMGFRECKNMR